MQKIKKIFNYFTMGEKILWLCSALITSIFFFVFKNKNYFYFISPFFGITAILLNAKGNPFGQAVMVVFAMAYGAISLSYRYYGELITYTCMTLPMSILSLISWFKNRFNKNKLEVKINKLTIKEVPYATFFICAVTVSFYFILGAFDTPNLILSTLSVTTSFSAVYFTFRRSSLFSFFYALNDIVLIWLWILASIDDTSYISMVICFATFLALDIYSYLCWQKMKKRQSKATEETNE